MNQLTEGSLEKLTQDRLLVLDWTRALGKFLIGMEVDADCSEKAIPAGAITHKKEKPLDGSASSASAATSPNNAAKSAATPKNATGGAR